MKALFVLIVSAMIVFVIKTSHTGKLDCGIIAKGVGELEVGHRGNYKGIINGKQVDYYAASFKRCDELYKYCHCIGRGTMEGSNQLVYLYVPNDSNRLITTQQLLAEQKRKHK